MEFTGVTDIAIHGVACVVDLSVGSSDTLRLITAKEKYFETKLDDGLLSVTQVKPNILYRIIMHRIELKVVLPKGFRGKLKFKNENGGLYANGGSFTEFDLFTKNGRFEISDVKCDQFSLKMKNGNIALKKLDAAGNAVVKCKNGTVKVESASAKEFYVSCANAALTTIDVSANKFECSTKNGAIDASAITADELRLETSNGKINAAPLGRRDDYKLEAMTAHGVITVDGVAQKRISDAIQLNKRLSAKTLNGDIDIRFM